MTCHTYHTWQSLSLYYFKQVVNSQRGHHAVIALLHRRSDGHRHGPGMRELANMPKVGKCMKFRKITSYFSKNKSIVYFRSVRVLQGDIVRNVEFFLLQIFHLFKDLEGSIQKTFQFHISEFIIVLSYSVNSSTAVNLILPFIC